MSSKMDAILALDRPPTMVFDPIVVANGVEFWPIQPAGLWYVQPGARMPILADDIQQPILVVTGDRSQAILAAQRWYQEWHDQWSGQ